MLIQLELLDLSFNFTISLFMSMGCHLTILCLIPVALNLSLAMLLFMLVGSNTDLLLALGVSQWLEVLRTSHHSLTWWLNILVTFFQI